MTQLFKRVTNKFQPSSFESQLEQRHMVAQAVAAKQRQETNEDRECRKFAARSLHDRDEEIKERAQRISRQLLEEEYA